MLWNKIRKHERVIDQHLKYSVWENTVINNKYSKKILTSITRKNFNLIYISPEYQHGKYQQ